MYYLEEETQEAIAARLGISRQKVQRSLKKARDDGVVEIRINPSLSDTHTLAAAVQSRFQLRGVYIAPCHSNPQAQRKSVAQAAARFLESYLQDDMVIAVGMGRNVGELPGYFNPNRCIKCTFVAAMGGSPKVDLRINPNEICRSLAVKCGGQASVLYAPAFVENVEMRNMLVQQETVNHTLGLARHAGCALVGIGGTDDDCTLVNSGLFSVDQIRQLRSSMAVGDILGNYFDIYGRVISSDLYGRLIGLTLENLRHIDTVVTVVSDDEKPAAILGALRAGVVDILVVDSRNAREILNLAEVYPDERR